MLRDLFKRGKYPDVILPMCVIRRMDAVLEPTKQKVLDTKKMLDEARITEQRAALCDAAGQAFYNTSRFTLRDLKSRGSQQQLLADFEDYLNGFSPNVQDILENFKFRNQLQTLSKNCPRCICTSPRLFAMSSESGSRARALRNEASAPSRSPSVCSATPSCMWARAIAAFRANRRAQMFDRAERVAALAEHDAEVVLRFGMPGIELHGALQRGQRAIGDRASTTAWRRDDSARRRAAATWPPPGGSGRWRQPSVRAGRARSRANRRRGPCPAPARAPLRTRPPAPDQSPLPLELDAAGEEPRGVAGAGVRFRLSPDAAGTCGSRAGQQEYRERVQCPRGESEASTHGRPMSP